MLKDFQLSTQKKFFSNFFSLIIAGGGGIGCNVLKYFFNIVMPMLKQKKSIPQHRYNTSLKVNWGNICVGSIFALISVTATFLTTFNAVSEEVNIVIGLIVLGLFQVSILSLFKLFDK